MTQYINLYQAEFRQENNLRRIYIASAIGFVIAILIGINVFQQVSIHQLGQELQQKQDLLNSRKQIHQALETRAQPKKQDPALLAQLETLRKANQSRLRALNFLSGKESGNMVGFSFLLEGLGRQRDNIEGIWLKKIHFDDGGFNLRLDGNSFSAELLPQLVQTLGKEEILRGHEFKHVKITRSTEHKNIMDFELDTKQHEQARESGDNLSEITLFMTKLKQLTSAQKAQN